MGQRWAEIDILGCCTTIYVGLAGVSLVSKLFFKEHDFNYIYFLKWEKKEVKIHYVDSYFSFLLCM